MARLVGQDENYFKVMRDDGQVVDVAKKGLSPGRAEYFSGLPGEARPSSINSESVANMPETVEPKTGQVLQNNQAQLPPQTPLVADLGQDVAIVPGSVDLDPQGPSSGDFAIPQKQGSPIEQESFAEKYKSALVQEGEANAQGMKGQSDVYKENLNETSQIERQFDQERNATEENKLEAEQSYREISNEYYNSKEVDQGRYWDNQSTGQKIMAGIGLALASLNPQAMKVALGSISRAIDRDIQAQRLEIVKKKDQVQGAKGLVAQFDRKLQNLDASEKAAKMAALEKAKLKMEMIGAQTKSKTMQAKTQQAVSQAEMELAKTKQEFDEEIAKNQINIGGYKGTIDNVQEAKDFRDAMNNLSSAKASINRLLEIGDQTGKSLNLNLKAEAETIQRMLIGALRVPIVGPGALSEAELNILDKLVANPTDIFSLDSNNKVKLKTLMKTLEQKTAETAKNLGLEKYEGVRFKAE